MPSRAKTVLDAIDYVLDGRRPDALGSVFLSIVETGSIRNADASRYADGDGYSTLNIARHLLSNKIHAMFFSIDLDTTVAKQVIRDAGLTAAVYFIDGNSLDILPRFLDAGIDIAYLDSANDADHILEEFKLVEAAMSNGIVVVDDVDMESTELVKGHKVVPYARERGYRVDLLPRQAVIYVN